MSSNFKLIDWSQIFSTVIQKLSVRPWCVRRKERHRPKSASCHVSWLHSVFAIFSHSWIVSAVICGTLLSAFHSFFNRCLEVALRRSSGVFICIMTTHLHTLRIVRFRHLALDSSSLPLSCSLWIPFFQVWKKGFERKFIVRGKCWILMWLGSLKRLKQAISLSALESASSLVENMSNRA